MYLSPDEAREHVRRERLVAEFVPGSGARCTLCGEWGEWLYKCVATLSNGTRRRHFRCLACGKKFIADEVYRIYTVEPRSVD